MIKEYLQKNNILAAFTSPKSFEIESVGTFYFVEEKDGIIINDDYTLNLSDLEGQKDVDYYCFRFGDGFYYTSVKGEIEFTPLRYLGKYESEYDLEFDFLGLHGGFELCNGSRSYSDWIKKAKFLNIYTLGIVEKNTLAGALKFQLECNKHEIKPIIGEQIVVKDGDSLLQFKCYAKNKTGWQNLLKINKEINVINHGFIAKNTFLELTKGLSVVIDTKYSSHKKTLPYELNIDDLYWQLDTVEFNNDSKDEEYLLNIKQFMQSSLRPVLISDAYYLDREDGHIKSVLNKIGSISDYSASEQHFKSLEENFNTLAKLFDEEDDRLFDLFAQSIDNVKELSDNCNFQIQTGVKYLTPYILSEEEKETYGDKENLFWSLIEEGMKEKVLKKGLDLDLYMDRVDYEFNVISKVTSDFGDGIDYFLILWDIIEYCKQNDILCGLGRGSSGGSLVSYLLDITKIDPIEYGLLFERFLNEGRVESGGLPDIDTDFEVARRDEVKSYMESKYGKNGVCSVGTYGTFQIRAAIKKIAALNNIEYSYANKVSKKIEVDTGGWEDVFISALVKPVIKGFVHKHIDVIENSRLILKQPSNRSIHACATIVTPQNKEVFDYFPVRTEIKKDGESLIVSEWEGGELEEAGFLKEDILGIAELDKFKFILERIREGVGDNVDIYNLPYDDKKVYELFQEGHNGDVFHFGSEGLTGYCKDLKPDNIDELIAGISLYRPGAMDVNSHNEYIFRKDGDRDVVYHWNTENVLNDTFGLIVYQEQVMKIFQVLADYDLVTCDDIRRSLGKKKKEIIDKYHGEFVERVVKKGCPEDEAEEIWHELEVHAGYSFNKSHATVYAMTGYIGQWLKAHYPVEYWTGALQFDPDSAKDSKAGSFINEIKKINPEIELLPPTINFSKGDFTCDYSKKEIYWSLSKVKQVGKVALTTILEERGKNGEFYSLKEFIDRVPKQKVNKAVVINLIVAGAFDEICSIKLPKERAKLVDEYYEHTQAKRAEDDSYFMGYDNYWWQIKQKEISKFGEIDYRSLVSLKTGLDPKKYLEGVKVKQPKYIDKKHVFAGVIKSIVERDGKNGDTYAAIEIDSNNEIVNVTMWGDVYQDLEGVISEGRIIIFSGVIRNYNSKNTVQSHRGTEVYLIED